MRVLYDGWSLVYDPLSLESLHLLAILENLPPEISPALVLPARAPDWIDSFETRILPTPDTTWGRLQWQQFRLPSLARHLDIQLLHLTTPTASVWSSLSKVLSPTGFGAGIADWTGVPHRSVESAGLLDRLRISLNQGGLVRVNRIIWPRDLAEPGMAASVEALSPILPRDFFPDVSQLSNTNHKKPATNTPFFDHLQLPTDFILYHGPGGRQHLELLVQAWIWCAAAIREYFPLLLLGLDDGDCRVVSELVELYDLKDSLQVLPDVLSCHAAPNLPAQ